MNHTNQARTSLALAVLAIAGAAILTVGGGCASMNGDQRNLTILLVEYDGPKAAASANATVGDLKTRGIPEAFAITDSNHGSVCVGHYADMHDWRGTHIKDPEAERMLARLRDLRDARGTRPYADSGLIMPVPEPLPDNPWPLEKANGLYTLHVATWEAPGRAVSAQHFAAQLRAQGYEAYVFHDPRFSIVTIGAFGSDIFDKPEMVGRPGVVPKIISPKVLSLMKKFPCVRVEGELTPPEAHTPAWLAAIPNRDDQLVAAVTRRYFDMDLALINAKTGAPAGRGRAVGQARSAEDIPSLAASLTEQLLGGLPSTAVAPRIGVLAILALNPNAANLKADVAVLNQVEASLRRPRPIRTAGPTKIQFVDSDRMLKLLDAAGLSVAQVLTNKTLLSKISDVDYVLAGSVTEVTMGAGPPGSEPPATPVVAPTAPAGTPTPGALRPVPLTPEQVYDRDHSF